MGPPFSRIRTIITMPSLTSVALFAFFWRSYALNLVYPTSLVAGTTYSVQWNGQPSFLFTVEQFNPNKTLQSIITDNNVTYVQIDVPAGTQIGFVIEDSITPPIASDILTVQPNPLLSASISLASVSSLASTTANASSVSSTTATATTTKPSGSASPTTSSTQNTHHDHTAAIVIGCVIGGLFLITFLFRCCSGGGGDFSFGLDVSV